MRSIAAWMARSRGGACFFVEASPKLAAIVALCISNSFAAFVRAGLLDKQASEGSSPLFSRNSVGSRRAW